MSPQHHPAGRVGERTLDNAMACQHRYRKHGNNNHQPSTMALHYQNIDSSSQYNYVPFNNPDILRTPNTPINRYNHGLRSSIPTTKTTTLFKANDIHACVAFPLSLSAVSPVSSHYTHIARYPLRKRACCYQNQKSIHYQSEYTCISLVYNQRFQSIRRSSPLRTAAYYCRV
jgi:hypothetical protein